MSQLTRRDLARLAGASISAASFAGQAAAATHPNLIIVLADDQGYGDFSSHGHPEIRTPELDRFRGESVRFTDFHSTPMCTPTRAQLMTGRDALSTRAMNVSSGRTLLRRDFPTLAEAFAASGYRTGIFGKWHLGDNYPYRPQDRGFQETVWYPSSHIGAVPDAWNNDYFNDRYRHDGHLQQYEGYSGDIFFDEAMRWMAARREAGEPFFTYLPLNVAHAPLFVPPRFLEPYKHVPERFARYYGMVANIDYNFGRLEKMLRDSGLRDSTIVVYLSDNGATKATMKHNAGMRGSKIELYEGGHRVPCFVRWPAGGIGGGKDIGELAEVQDLFPTAVDLCGLKRPSNAKFDGVSLAPLMQGRVKALPDRTLVVQFSRMDAPRPRKNDAAVMWKKWRLIGGNELYDLAADPGQQTNLFENRPEIAARLQSHYDRWWSGVEPALDSFLPVHIGSENENPTSLSACEWADVFLDQSAQVRRGEKKTGVWHVHAENAGEYEIALRRWPRECDAAIGAGVPPHKAEDGEYPAGVALPIARARLRIGSFDHTVDVGPEDREAVFRVNLPAGPAEMQSWFLNEAGEPIAGAYYSYVERKFAVPAARPQRVILDTDIQGDVDDAGAVALLHALANRGEAEILAMGVSAKHPWSPVCLDALNHYFGRPGIPIGVNKGPGFLRDSKYAEEIAAKWPHRLQSAAEAPDAVELYRSVLAKQPDRSVVMISIGQLTNLSDLLKTSGGADLVRRKVKLWVSMGAAFPSGREANIFHDAASAQHAVANWPTKVVFSGYEIGVEVLTGGKLAELPRTSPVRRAYELYNGIQPHKSWDQTAVLYGVRCVDGDCGLWTLSGPGECEIDDRGRNTWRKDPNGRHQFLMARMAPRQVAGIIEEEMVAAAQPGAVARYQPTWESLKTHPDPAWFDDAKFGIYFHWGPYSVPAFGTEWYSRNMYRPDRIEHKHHVEKYGTLDKFGYKDFIPMFRAEHFDPDEWAALFAQSGARFAGPVAEHADGFSMWDSRLTKWNAARMGPERDVVGEMARAIRKRNMKFLATFHHQWLWAWYPTFDPNVDASNPEYSGLYGPPVSETAWNYRKDQLKPDEAFCKLWRDKVKEVIDRYQPDLLYFDSRMGNIAEPYRKDLLAYYYNRALGWKREVALTYKQEDLERGAGILDVERGRMASLMPFKWMVDDSIDWKSWSYIEDASLKSAGRIVGELVDVVSKNGNLLLDITPRADGVIPEPVQERLREIGAWLKLNGEAIYGTRSWKTFGEGPTEVKEGTFGEKNIKDLTADDIRFTTRGDVLHAIVPGWPGRDISIRSLGIAAGLLSKKITRIQLIGSDEKVVWERGNESVVIRRPRRKPCEHAIVFKIQTT